MQTCKVHAKLKSLAPVVLMLCVAKSSICSYFLDRERSETLEKVSVLIQKSQKDHLSQIELTS